MASATPAQALSRLNCMAEIELDTALVPEDAQVISYKALEVKRCAWCKFDDPAGRLWQDKFYCDRCWWYWEGQPADEAKEVAKLGGSVDLLVPTNVAAALSRKFS